MQIRPSFLMYFLLFFLFYAKPAFSQKDSTGISNQNLPLYREQILLYENYLRTPGSNEHTSIKPFPNSPQLNSIKDSILKNAGSSYGQLPSIVLSDEKKCNCSLRVAGILSGELGYEKTNAANRKSLMEGGLSIDGSYKDHLSWNALFVSGNSSFPSYLNTSIVHSNVIPQMGSAYSSNSGYSYQYYSGYLSYSPNKIFNFQIGKDKHFWGDGYRSLLLSDVSNSFPFLQLSTTIWKIKYVSLFGIMKDLTNSSGFKKDFLNKYGSFHYLSWNATKRINLSLFESVIWQGTDANTNRIRNFDVNYLNPVIFYRPVEYSLGSSDNAMLGINFKVKLSSHYQFYGQIILDEFLLNEIKAMNGWWGNKQGLQFGLKSFDLFKIKNLYFQTEVNAVRRYTYSHGSIQQNYSNYYQPLAHPLGANFIESVSFLNYRFRKLVFETEFLHAVYGKDKNGQNYGGNIFESYTTRPNEYGNFIGQGLKTNLAYAKLLIGYYLISSSNLLAETGIALRQEQNASYNSNSTYFFIGIKTNILNRYNDF